MMAVRLLASYRSIFVTLLTISFTSSAYSASIVVKSKQWDILIFTQSWPNEVCSRWQKENRGTCSLYPKNTWTVHGIWPNKLGTKGPGYCDDSKPFVEGSIKDLEDELLYHWTPVQKKNKVTSFWAHEWKKHGTCSMEIPGLSNQVKFFSQAVAWSKKYNMYKILANSGITPGAYYQPIVILGAVKSALNKSAILICNYDKIQRRPNMIEIRICFDKRLDLIDCKGTYTTFGNSNTNCKTTTMVYYPQV